MKFIDIIRKERNDMLAATDWTQMPDLVLHNNEKEEWATYRQALRDILANTDSFFDKDRLFWPSPPAKYRLLDGNYPITNM
jgi:hypothetical protein